MWKRRLAVRPPAKLWRLSRVKTPDVVFGYAHAPWMKKRQASIPEASLPNALQRFARRKAIPKVSTEERGYQAIDLDPYARRGDATAETDALSKPEIAAFLRANR